MLVLRALVGQRSSPGRLRDLNSQQDDVVVVLIGHELVDYAIAQRFRRGVGQGHNEPAEPPAALVEVRAPPVDSAFDQPVGVEQQRRPDRQADRCLGACWEPTAVRRSGGRRRPVSHDTEPSGARSSGGRCPRCCTAAEPRASRQRAGRRTRWPTVSGSRPCTSWSSWCSTVQGCWRCRRSCAARCVVLRRRPRRHGPSRRRRRRRGGEAGAVRGPVLRLVHGARLRAGRRGGERHPVVGHGDGGAPTAAHLGHGQDRQLSQGGVPLHREGLVEVCRRCGPGLYWCAHCDIRSPWLLPPGRWTSTSALPGSSASPRLFTVLVCYPSVNRLDLKVA